MRARAIVLVGLGDRDELADRDALPSLDVVGAHAPRADQSDVQLVHLSALLLFDVCLLQSVLMPRLSRFSRRRAVCLAAG